MNNTCTLIKMARDIKDDNSGKKAMGAAAIAYGTGTQVPGQILGYHTVYHGSKDRSNADRVRKEGLKVKFGGDPSKGGEASYDSKYTDHSKGKAFVTKNRSIAKRYASGNSALGTDFDKHVIKGVMSHHEFSKLHKDDDFHYNKALNNKHSSSYSTKDIPGRIFEGNSEYKGSKKFRSLKRIKSYLSSGSGKRRFALGLLNAGVSAGSTAYAGKKLYEKVRDRNLK